jgi:hypothetical protein
MAKDISNCLLNVGTSLIIDSNGTVSKYVDGNFSNTILVEKHESFLITYFEFKYDATKDKIPLKIQLPTDETIIHITPSADKYTNEIENGKTTISIIWDKTNPRDIYLEYGNVFSNFIRNLIRSLGVR